MIGSGGILAGGAELLLAMGGILPTVHAVPRPINMNTYVPTDLSATPVAASNIPYDGTLGTTAIMAVVAYIDRIYPALARTMPIRVTSIRLVHADSAVPRIGTQDLWLVSVSGIPNQWSSSAASPYSDSLFIVSVETGKVLEQVMTGPLTGHLGY